jgi:hypothetical protein
MKTKIALGGAQPLETKHMLTPLFKLNFLNFSSQGSGRPFIV